MIKAKQNTKYPFVRLNIGDKFTIAGADKGNMMSSLAQYNTRHKSNIKVRQFGEPNRKGELTYERFDPAVEGEYLTGDVAIKVHEEFVNGGRTTVETDFRKGYFRESNGWAAFVVTGRSCVTTQSCDNEQECQLLMREWS